MADKLYDALGNDVDHFFNVDPVSIWLLDPKSLKQGLAEITAKVGDEYVKAKPGTKVKSAHVGMAASNAHVFFTDVLPRAIKKHDPKTGREKIDAAVPQPSAVQKMALDRIFKAPE